VAVGIVCAVLSAGASAGFAAVAPQAEYVAQCGEFLLIYKAYACLGDFALQDTLVAGVAEDAHIHRLCFVQEVFK